MTTVNVLPLLGFLVIRQKMRGRPQWLDRERCFYLWMELGSIWKVRHRLYSEGVKNPTTGKVASEIGVRVSAWKYVLYNPEYCRQKFIDRVGVYGDDQLDLWLGKLDRLAIAFLTTRADRYRVWKKEIYDPYVEEVK